MRVEKEVKKANYLSMPVGTSYGDEKSYIEPLNFYTSPLAAPLGFFVKDAYNGMPSIKESQDDIRPSELRIGNDGDINTVHPYLEVGTEMDSPDTSSDEDEKQVSKV